MKEPGQNGLVETPVPLTCIESALSCKVLVLEDAGSADCVLMLALSLELTELTAPVPTLQAHTRTRTRSRCPVPRARYYIAPALYRVSACSAAASALRMDPHRTTTEQCHCWTENRPPTCLNDYRPVAPIIMKCFERLVLRHIKTLLPPSLDPLQFAYRPNRSTDDAISTTLHLALTHLDNRDTYVRMLFIDFSSAFSTIIPQHLIGKLNLLGLNTSLSNWILDFLTGRPPR
ncbi:hypothetical protein NFI96_030846 [Prochilodus magdalenae]|nr:hypothetical protein NFI96_030846 [Prochilodus magdalenae]